MSGEIDPALTSDDFGSVDALPARSNTRQHIKLSAKDRAKSSMCVVQGYLAHKTPPPARTLQKDCTQGPMMVLRGEGVIFYERGTPVTFIGSGNPPTTNVVAFLQ